MNTTHLIQQWSMSGADDDIASRFRSVAGTRGTSAEGDRRESAAAPTHSLSVRHAEDEEWLPLSVGDEMAGASQ